MNNVYAIRVPRTNLYFSNLREGMRRGYSFRDPEENGGTYGPRLFTSKHAAVCAVASWRRGTVNQKVHQGLLGVEADYVIKPVEGRDIQPLEVVMYSLVEEYHEITKTAK